MSQEKSAARNEVLVGVVLAFLAFIWLLAFIQLAPGRLAWTLTRVRGVTGYVFLTCSMALGALTSNSYIPKWLNRAIQFGWHGLLSGFALVLVAVHIAFTLVDTQYPQTLLGVLVPGQASYDPLALAIGTQASYGMVTVYTTFAYKHKLPRRVWHGFHLFAYPSFILATTHGVLAGTTNLKFLYITASSLVVLTFLIRLFELRKAPKAQARVKA